jgi:uncharacterized membrane protein YfcA
MSPFETSYILFCFFTASFVKGLTGMGFAISSLALLALFFDPKAAIPLILLPAFCANLMVVLTTRHFRATLKRFRLYYLATIPGLILGVWLLTKVSSSTSRTALGIILLFYALSALLHFDRYPCRESSSCAAVTGLLTGTINGITGCQVMPLLPWLLSLKLKKDELVQALNISFTLGIITMFILLRRNGLLGAQQLFLSLVGVAVSMIGVAVGTKVRARLNEELFRKLILLFLLFLGMMILFFHH